MIPACNKFPTTVSTLESFGHSTNPTWRGRARRPPRLRFCNNFGLFAASGEIFMFAASTIKARSNKCASNLFIDNNLWIYPEFVKSIFQSTKVSLGIFSRLVQSRALLLRIDFSFGSKLTPIRAIKFVSRWKRSIPIIEKCQSKKKKHVKKSRCKLVQRELE